MQEVEGSSTGRDISVSGTLVENREILGQVSLQVVPLLTTNRHGFVDAVFYFCIVTGRYQKGRFELGPSGISDLDEKVLPLYRQGPPVHYLSEWVFMLHL